jgi:hypothetical protein
MGIGGHFPETAEYGLDLIRSLGKEEPERDAWLQPGTQAHS